MNLSLRDYIRRYEYLYPDIDSWFKKALRSQDKRIYSVVDKHIILGLAIIDLEQGKFCHFSTTDVYTHPLSRKQRKLLINCLYKTAMLEFSYHGVHNIFAHGHPDVVSRFRKSFKGWEIVKDLHKFGRTNSEPDQLIRLEI